MRIARSFRAPFLGAIFSVVFLASAAPRVAAQTASAAVIPAPPFIATPGIGMHHAEQNAADPETAHDSLSGQDLKWDATKKSWVDTKTGQALGFDGELASDGTVIPAPPFIYTPGVGLHQARQNPPPPAAPAQAVPANANNADGATRGYGRYGRRFGAAEPRAYDSAFSQPLRWDGTKNSWIDLRNDEALGYDGAANQARTCGFAEDSVVLKALYDDTDANVIAAVQALSQATADRQSDLAHASQLDKSASSMHDSAIATAERQQAQGLRDKLANAQANYDAANAATLAAWQNFQDSLARLAQCPAAPTAQSESAPRTATPSAGAGFAFVDAD